MVAAAPWLPLYNLRSLELLSRRLGGYRYHSTAPSSTGPGGSGRNAPSATA